MLIVLIEFTYASFVAAVGVVVGYWLHGRCGLDQPGPSAEADEETQRARDVLGRLHDLAARVAADVGEHSSRVEEINVELASNEARETNVVVAAVQELVQANDRMQRQLATAEERLQEQAKQTESHATEARTDALTGLANRRALDDETANRLVEFKTCGKPFSLVIVDVDHFKRFNDSFGHRSGDEVLRGVGRVLRRGTPETAIPARYGGEEFAVVLPDTPVRDATTVAEHLRRMIDNSTFRFGANDLHVSVSAGVAEIIEGEDVATMIDRADTALYTSKTAGRNCTHWHDGRQPHLVGEEPEPTQPAPETGPVEEAEPEQTSAELEQTLPPPESTQGGGVAAEICEAQTSDPCDKVTFWKIVGNRLAEWRRGGETPAILFLRIDDYDSIVSARGQQVGKRIISTTRQFLKAAVRDMDVIAHYDASTFALLLPGAGLANAAAAGERLRRAIARCALPMKGGHVKFTVSVGGAEAVTDDDTRRLLARAQEALSAAAKSGGDCSYLHNGQWSELLETAQEDLKTS